MILEAPSPKMPHFLAFVKMASARVKESSFKMASVDDKELMPF